MMTSQAPNIRNRWVRPCTWSWLLLLLLTLFTYGVGQLQLGGVLVVGLILLTTLVKGEIVVNYFMGLRRVRMFWRVVMFLYLWVVGSLIGVAYVVGLH